MKTGMTASSPSLSPDVGFRTPAGAVSVVRAGPGRREQAVQLVLAVQAVTGLPDPTMWPAELLAPHTRDRHRRALEVWVALIDNQVVGHALITTVAPGHLEWARTGDEGCAAAFAAGTLVELGGLSPRLTPGRGSPTGWFVPDCPGLRVAQNLLPWRQYGVPRPGRPVWRRSTGGKWAPVSPARWTCTPTAGKAAHPDGVRLHLRAVEELGGDPP